MAQKILDLTKEHIVVTGAYGFLGHHLMQLLHDSGCNVTGVRSAEYDLRDEDAVRQMYADCKPTVVFHLAADVGGIGANQQFPGQFFYNNLLMGAYLIEQARLGNVKKFVSVGTVCSYPKFTPLPFQEKDIWDGYPEETNAPYGLAKKMQMVQLQAYRQEYNFCGIHLLPGNLYGPFDHFEEQNSHVIPAIILKIYNAMHSDHPVVELWGDGSPSREFLYASDCAAGLYLAAERLWEPVPVNLGTGVETKIVDVAQMIADAMGYRGKIAWDVTKPNGQPRRCLDVSLAKELFGFEAQTPLRQGIQDTVAWYLQQQE